MIKKIALILISILVLYGCKPEIRIVELNNTIIKETICQATECKCVFPETFPKEIEKECDDTLLNKCNLVNARLIWEVDYYKNLTVNTIINDTSYQVQKDLTECISNRTKLQERLDKITAVFE